MIFFRERNDNVPLFSGIRANQLFLKARNEHAGTNLQLLSLSGAALKLLLTCETGIIQNDGIPFADRSFRQNHSRISLLQRFDLFVNVRFLNLDLFLFNFYAQIILNLDDRVDRNRDGNGQRLALADLGEFGCGTVDDFQLQFLDGGRIRILEQVVDRIFKEDAFAVMLFDDASWSLTLSEAVDHELILRCLVSLYDCSLKLFSSKIHRKLYIVIFFGKKGCFH